MMKSGSHRVYWQQWSNINTGNNSSVAASDNPLLGERNRRELVTSSAAIRIPEAARARDVTQVLREKLFPSSTTTATAHSNDDDNRNYEFNDSLVLLGSLYSLPLDYIQFEHETKSQSNQNTGMTTGSFSILHVVKTLSPDDTPLVIWKTISEHLEKRKKSILHHHRIRRQSSSSSTTTDSSTTISQKLQWFFVPGLVVPSATLDKVSNISSVIDLEGYCTSMEDEEEDNNEGGMDRGSEVFDDDGCGHVDDVNELLAGGAATPFPWQHPTTAATSDGVDVTVMDCNDGEDDSSKLLLRREQQQQRELRLAFRLSSYREQHPYCKAGYLLLQCQRDAQLWRQVYCVLTEDTMWYVSRIYYHVNDESNDNNNMMTDSTQSNSNNSSSMAWSHHGRIPLSRALLLEHPITATNNNNDNSNSFVPRIPLGLEIVQANGTSHVFRASSRSIQQNWIQALSHAMSSCHENSLLEHAQVIVEEETRARYQRLRQVAIQPLWNKVATTLTAPAVNNTTTPATTITLDPRPLTLLDVLPNGHVMNVLRLGMQVASYREQCRHAQQQHQQFKQQHQQEYTSLPATQKASTPAPQSKQPRPKLPSPPPHPKQQLPPSQQPSTKTAAERAIASNIQETWDAATILLARTTQVASELQTTGQTAKTLYQSPPRTQTTTSTDAATTTTTTPATFSGITSAPPPQFKRAVSRSSETLCRHIDYIITGRLRPLSPVGSSNSISGNYSGGSSTSSVLTATTIIANHPDPAPVDLFDPILSELQSLAVVADAKVLQLVPR